MGMTCNDILLLIELEKNIWMLWIHGTNIDHSLLTPDLWAFPHEQTIIDNISDTTQVSYEVRCTRTSTVQMIHFHHGNSLQAVIVWIFHNLASSTDGYNFMLTVCNK